MMEISEGSIDTIGHQRERTMGRVLAKIWKYGLVSYGGPIAHIAMFRKEFVEELGWVPEDYFDQMFAICQSVPGPTSTQLLILITIYVSSSILTGIVAFALWSLPSYLILTLSAEYLQKSDFITRPPVHAIMAGLQAAAAAIIFDAFWSFSKKYHSSPMLCLIIVASACVSFEYSSGLVLIGTLVVSGIVTLLFYEPPAPPSSFLELGLDHWLYGRASLLLLLGGLGVAVLARQVWGGPFTVSIDVFYRIGMLVIGGGHVILPLMNSEFEGLGYFTTADFWNGFSIISCLPGPLFNLSAYVGTLAGGPLCGLLSFLALNIPSFLMIWGIIPYYQKYRMHPPVNKFITGVCAASVGLILAAGVGLLAEMQGVVLPVLAGLSLVWLVVWSPPSLAVLATAAAIHLLFFFIS
jgi:chromate transporter